MAEMVRWCEAHESRFLEKQPSKYALCLLSLHEGNFQAIGWEDCDPVLVRVVGIDVLARVAVDAALRTLPGVTTAETVMDHKQWYIPMDEPGTYLLVPLSEEE